MKLFLTVNQRIARLDEAAITRLHQRFRGSGGRGMQIPRKVRAPLKQDAG